MSSPQINNAGKKRGENQLKKVIGATSLSWRECLLHSFCLVFLSSARIHFKSALQTRWPPAGIVNKAILLLKQGKLK